MHWKYEKHFRLVKYTSKTKICCGNQAWPVTDCNWLRLALRAAIFIWIMLLSGVYKGQWLDHLPLGGIQINNTDWVGYDCIVIFCLQPWKVEENICLFCGKSLNQRNKPTTTVSRGLQAIVEKSVEYGDGLHTKFTDCSSIIMHTDCRKNYTRWASKHFSTDNISPETPSLCSAMQEFEFQMDSFSVVKKPVKWLKNKRKLNSEEKFTNQNIWTDERYEVGLFVDGRFCIMEILPRPS